MIEKNGREDTKDVLEVVIAEIDTEYKQAPLPGSLPEEYRDGGMLKGEQLGQLSGSGRMNEADWDRLQEMYGANQ